LHFEDAPMVGIYLCNHGCQDWSIYLLKAERQSDSVVWKGDIDDWDDIDEDENLAGSWVDWLRGFL
jgi:hypothetical protein